MESFLLEIFRDRDSCQWLDDAVFIWGGHKLWGTQKVNLLFHKRLKLDFLLTQEKMVEIHGNLNEYIMQMKQFCLFSLLCRGTESKLMGQITCWGGGAKLTFVREETTHYRNNSCKTISYHSFLLAPTGALLAMIRQYWSAAGRQQLFEVFTQPMPQGHNICMLQITNK